MPTFAVVRAAKREGFPGYHAAQRHFSSDAPTVLEMVDKDEDPIVDPNSDEPSVTVNVVVDDKDEKGNVIARHMEARKVSATKVGRNTMKALLAEKGFITVEQRSAASADKLKLDEDLSTAEAQSVQGRNSALEEENRKLKERLAQLEGKANESDADKAKAAGKGK